MCAIETAPTASGVEAEEKPLIKTAGQSDESEADIARVASRLSSDPPRSLLIWKLALLLATVIHFRERPFARRRAHLLAATPVDPDPQSPFLPPLLVRPDPWTGPCSAADLTNSGVDAIKPDNILGKKKSYWSAPGQGAGRPSPGATLPTARRREHGGSMDKARTSHGQYIT